MAGSQPGLPTAIAAISGLSSSPWWINAGEAFQGAHLAQPHSTDHATEKGAQAVGHRHVPHFELTRVSACSIGPQHKLPIFLLADIQDSVIIVSSEPVLNLPGQLLRAKAEFPENRRQFALALGEDSG